MLRDNLWELMLDPDVFSFSISHPMDVEFACTQEVAAKLVTKRNCWIAQEDLWAPVIRLINSQGQMALPCSNGPCTAQRDNQLRKEGKDPAPPCPRYARLHEELFTPEQKERATDYLALKPTTKDFWREELEYV
jgi:hypothetical protein